MSSNIFLQAADATACRILGNAADSLVGFGTVSTLVPGGQKIGMVSLTTGMIGTYVHEVGCPPMDLGFAPTPPPAGKGCQEVSNGGQLWRYLPDNGQEVRVDGANAPTSKIIATEYNAGDESQGLSPMSVVYWEDINGDFFNNRASLPAGYSEPIYYIIPNPDSECVRDDHTDLPPVPDVPVEQYIDQTTNCIYNVKLVGALQELPGSDAQLVYQIESAEQTRADGGRVGGCFLAPHIYVHRPGPNGPNPPIPPIPVPPFPPDPVGGVPWWAAPLLGGATGAALNLIGQELARLTEPNYEAGTFTLTAPCDYTEEGDNVSYFFPFPKGNFQQRVIDHQMAILDVLQYHLNSKTPTCSSNEKPPLEGEWVTTRWESTEKMAHSGICLRKLFRYRTKSPRNLGQLSAYWETFTWEAGPVCVFHKGAWWGTPQVWAASQEEGKRVIRFAAAEAGIDPDQDGEWGISSSRSPRYGMSATMKIQLYKGFPWISARSGPDYPNTLAKAHTP